MLDTIREAGIGRLSAEVEVGLARMTHRPLADAVVEIEQAGLVGDFGARLGWHQAARRGRRNRRLLVAGTLTDETTGADRAILHLGGRAWRRRRLGRRRSGRSSGGRRL